MIDITLKNKVIFIFILGVLSGCTPITTMKTTKNPETTATVYKKIMVEAHTADLKKAMDIEWTFKQTLNNSELHVVAASDLFLPPREMTYYERREILDKNGIEAVLVVTLKDYQKVSIYHPPTSTEKKVKRNKNGTVTTTYTSSGDYTENRMTQDHELVLLNLQEKPVWVASASTIGDFTYNDDRNFVSALAKKTQKKLAKDGLIKLPEPPPKNLPQN